MKTEPSSPVLKPHSQSLEKPRRKQSLSNRNDNIPKYRRYSRSRSRSKSPAPRNKRNVPLYKNLSWVRPASPPKEEVTPAKTGSLLTRIEPASDSLLRRLNLADPMMSGETASSATSGGDKIANPTRKLTASEKEAEDFAEKLIRESEADIVQKVQKKEDTIQVVPDAQHTDGGRGPLNKIPQVSMHPESNDVGKRSLSEPEPGEVSESPESMVPANGPKAKIDSPTRNYPRSLSLVEKAVNDIATASSSDMTTHISPDLHKHPHPSIVDEARRLLMPIIVKTVQLQEPQAAIRKIEGKVSQLITDQHCWDFVRLAKEVKEQMRSRGDRSWSPMRNSAYENRGRESLNGSDRSGFDQVAETHGELRVWNGDASRDRGSGSSGTGYRRRELPSPVRDIPDADYPRQNEPRRDRSRERCRERSQDTIRRSSSRNSPRHDDGRKVHTNGQGSKRGRGSRSPSGEVSRPAKVLRGLSPAVSSQPPAQISQPPVVRKEKEPGGDSSAIEPGSFNLSTSSSPKKATPKMPKAMLADHTVLAIDSFLANASMVSTATTQPISASEKVPGESDGVLQSAPSGAREEKTQLILAANDDLSHSGIVNQNNQVVQADAGSSVTDIQVASKAGEVERHVQEIETMDTSETIYPNQIQPEKSGQDQGCLLLRVLKQDEEIVCDSIPAALSPAVQPIVPEILDPLPLESNLPPVPLQDVDMSSSAEDAVQLRIESSTYVQTGRRTTRGGVEESAQVQMDEAHNGIHSAEGSTATPIAEESTASPQSRSSSPQIPPCIVPGFWFASVGKPHPDVLDFEFVVDAESAGAALHWGGRNVTFDVEAKNLALYLLCLPTEEAAEMNTRLDQPATPREVANAMWAIETRWPPRGKLIVQFNPEEKHEKSWFPVDFKNGRPIEVSEYVRPGKNTARIIQLGNMEDRLFILFAAVPPEDEVKIYIERTTRKIHSESGKLIEQPSTRPAKSAEGCS